MWWIVIIILIVLILYNFYYNDRSNPLRLNSYLETQIAGGIGSPRNYLIYANGKTIDPNNRTAVLQNFDPYPHPSLDYLRNEYYILRTRAESSELDPIDMQRLRRLQKQIMAIESQMQDSSRNFNQTGGMVIDADMGSDILTGTGSGPPISPPLGPLPGAPLAPQVSQLGVLKDSISTLLETVYRIPQTVIPTTLAPDLGGPSPDLTSYRPVNRADPYYGAASPTQVPTIDLARNLRDGISVLSANMTINNPNIITNSMELASLSQILESRLSAEGKIDVFRQQAYVTNLLRSVTIEVPISELRERIAQALGAQEAIYLSLSRVNGYPMIPPTVLPTGPAVTTDLAKRSTVDAEMAAQRAREAQQAANDAALAAQRATQRSIAAEQAAQAALNAQAIVQPGSQTGAPLTNEVRTTQTQAERAKIEADTAQRQAAAAAAANQAAQEAARVANAAAQQAQETTQNQPLPIIPTEPVTPTTPIVPTSEPVTIVPQPQMPQPQMPQPQMPQPQMPQPQMPQPQMPQPQMPQPQMPQPQMPQTQPPAMQISNQNGNFARQPRTIAMPGYATELSDQERWIRAHNFFRRLHCAPPVTWNPELENLARGWGNKLATEPPRQGGIANIDHPTTPAEESQYLTLRGAGASQDFGGRVGQNLAWGGPDIQGSGNQQSYRKEIEDVVADWYEEVYLPNFASSGFSVQNGQITFTPIENRREQIQRFFAQNPEAIANCPPGLAYKYDAPQRCNPGTGHFTQVVWEDTNQIGCAKIPHQTIPGTYIWVCNYNPPGNIQGEYQENVNNPATCAASTV